MFKTNWGGTGSFGLEVAHSPSKAGPWRWKWKWGSQGELCLLACLLTHVQLPFLYNLGPHAEGWHPHPQRAGLT